jgi:hypothetical protein
MRGEPGTKVTLTLFRKNESRSFPVVHRRARRSACKACAPRWSSPATPGCACQPVPGPHGRRLRAQARGDLQAGAQPEGPGAGPAQRPGRLLDGAIALSAAFLPPTWSVVTTNGQISRVAGHLQGHARVLRAPPRQRPAAQAAGGGEDGAAGGAGQRGLGLGQRDRGRRTARPQARHVMGAQTFGKGSVQTVRPLSAEHRAEDHHRALLHAQRAMPSRPRASCPTSGSTKPPRATSSPPCACARPTSTSTSAAPTKRPRTPRAKAREEARKSSSRSNWPREGAAQAAARVRHRRGLPAAPGAEPAAATSRWSSARPPPSARPRPKSTDVARKLPPTPQPPRGPWRLPRPAMDDQQLLRYSRHMLLDELGIEGQQPAAGRPRAGRRCRRPGLAGGAVPGQPPASAASRWSTTTRST